MRNNALMFFGGIATAAVVQFVTQREWRVNPVNQVQASELRADEVPLAANDDGDRSDPRSEDRRATRDRGRMPGPAGRPARPGGRRDDYGRREDERFEDRSVSWTDDGADQQQTRDRRRFDAREDRGQPDWRYAADERPARDFDWRERDEYAQRDDRGPDRAVAWQPGPGPRGPEGWGPGGRGPVHRGGPRSGGGGAGGWSSSSSSGSHSGSWSESGPGAGPAFAWGQSRGARFGHAPWGPRAGWGRDERIAGGRRFQFARFSHFRGHHQRGWAGRGRTSRGWAGHGRGTRGWVSHRHHGGHRHRAWSHGRGRGWSFARHSMRGHHRFAPHAFARDGFGHRSAHRGFAHRGFARHGFGRSRHFRAGLGRHHFGGGRRFAFHGRGQWGPRGSHHAGRAGFARLAMRRANARIDALFAAADVNKDGKLTKEEFANFMWKRFAKPDAQSVTKDEMKSFLKQRITALRAERPGGRRHKGKAGGGAPKKEEPKPGAAQPKPAPAATPKAEVKPAAAPATAASPAAPAKPAGPTQPAVSKTAPTNASVNKSAGVSQAESGPPALPRNTGPKIGTSTTSGDVKAALFAARR